MISNHTSVLVRGAGEMASGIAVRLHRARFRVVLTDIFAPLCVRRTVSFCEAIHNGRAVVEGIEAVNIASPEGIEEVWNQGRLPVLVDPDLDLLSVVKVDVLVDAILAKRNLNLNPDLAELMIGIGPGFWAGRDVDVVIESQRGHHLGRVIHDGPAAANTGVPGDIGGQTALRVLRAPAKGVLTTPWDIGAQVEAGQVVAEVAGREIKAQISGLLRGLIRPGTLVHPQLKVGDIDPRGDPEYCHSVSDKARAIGGAVLETILSRFNR